MNLKDDILFKVRRSEGVPICENPSDPVVHPNTEVGSAPISSRVPAKTHKAKISTLHFAIGSILKDNAIAALITDDGSVYCEITKDSEIQPAYYNGAKLCTNADLNTHTGKKLFFTAFLLSKMITDSVALAETMTALEAVAEEYDSHGYVTKEQMAYLCDCFYFDVKDGMGNTLSADIPMEPFSSTTQLMVQQSVRANAMKLPSVVFRASHPGLVKFGNHFMTTFSQITYTAASVSFSPAYSGDQFLTQCKKGEFEIGFDWLAEQMGRIRPASFLDKFVPNEAFEDMVRLATTELNKVVDRVNATGSTGIETIGDSYLNTIFVGKPATGKTTTAEAISAATGLPIYTVANSKNTEEDTFEGKTKVANGSFIFRSTPFLEGYQHGGIIVLEEFNLSDPAVMQGALGQAIEYPFILMKDGYEEVHRHPLCIIISTMNTATQGSREPNEAFTSRAPITFLMDDPSEEEFINILHIKGYELQDCRAVYKGYSAIIDYLINAAGSEELAMQVTLRHCLGALKLMSIGVPIKRAIYKTMIGSIAIKDLALAKDVYENAIESIPL